MLYIYIYKFMCVYIYIYIYIYKVCLYAIFPMKIFQFSKMIYLLMYT